MRWVIVSFGVRVSVSLDYLVSLQTGDSLMMLYNFELSHNFDRATKDGCAENNKRKHEQPKLIAIGRIEMVSLKKKIII